MSLLARVHQKIFGSTGGVGEFGAFGSDSLGSVVTTKNLETIQSLAPFLQGLFAATNNANEPPRIQDLNGLFLLLTSQLGYLFQNGIPEWSASQEYYATVSYCQRSGVIYRSVTGTDGSPNLNIDPATDDGTHWEAGDSYYRQLKWDLDTLGFSGYALYTDKYLADKLRIARREIVGATIFSSFKITPTAFSASKSTANPGNPEYAPYVDRSIDQDISTANYPKMATLRDVKAKVKSVTDFTVTVTGSNVVFANDASGVAMVQRIIDDAKVAGWLNTSQTVDAAADFSTAASQLYLNIAGTDYAITNATQASRTIVVSGSPATGTQTAILYPFRTAVATAVRLRKLTGFVPVVEGDADGENVNGLRKLDRGQGHWHQNYTNTSGSGGANMQAGAFSSTPVTANGLLTKEAITDGVNGTPRTGKTTDPRAFGQYVYTFAGVYI